MNETATVIFQAEAKFETETCHSCRALFNIALPLEVPEEGRLSGTVTLDFDVLNLAVDGQAPVYLVQVGPAGFFAKDGARSKR